MAAGVSLLSELPHSGSGGATGRDTRRDNGRDTGGGPGKDTGRDTGGDNGRDNGEDMETAVPRTPRVPTAKYTRMGETLRHVIPSHMQCSMACGGRACKYENPSRWSDTEQAIRGLYSSWITDNLLAMARPSTETIEKYNIIEQFKRCGVRTVINLQRSGEHASCGSPLEPLSGFSYRPEVFMEADIYFYNFGWKDYGVASLTTILDMVKVMSFAILEGKMAIHCHAGLGRTGVLLACYLVFTSRMSADQAILFVRAKRPNSIQTRGQLLCVREFAHFLVPLRCVFPGGGAGGGAFTLSQYLARQRHLLHGYEARQLRYVPKPVQQACRLLRDAADGRMQRLPPLAGADLAAELEKTVSQQALQRLGSEMRGKGIPRPPSTPPSAPPPGGRPWRQRPPSAGQLELGGPCSPAPPPPARSYSDSALHAAGRGGSWGLRRPLSSATPTWTHVPPSPAPQEAPGSPQEPEQGTPQGGEEVLFPADVSPETRHLLVARALALQGTHEGVRPRVRPRVAMWQAELNSREGAWERLCTERDPLVLSSLMWAWLEQLKEPIISHEDIQALREKQLDPQRALDSLDKAQRLTLMCILDCVAHLRTIPEDVEASILSQTIRAFTKISPASEDQLDVCNTLKAVLTPVLHQLQQRALPTPTDPH